VNVLPGALLGQALTDFGGLLIVDLKVVSHCVNVLPGALLGQALTDFGSLLNVDL